MLHRLRSDPRWDVRALLTSVDAFTEAIAVHRLPAWFLAAQAHAAGLPLQTMPLPTSPDNASYEASFATALAALRQRWPDLHHVAFGDLFLDDVRGWREDLCRCLGWTPVFPLWSQDTATLARAMIDGGLRASLCCVDTTQLDAGFTGHRFDHALLDALPSAVDPCGERGEFHTAVFGGPMFAQPVAAAPTLQRLRADRFIYALPEALESGDATDGDAPWPAIT